MFLGVGGVSSRLHFNPDFNPDVQIRYKSNQLNISGFRLTEKCLDKGKNKVCVTL